MDLKTVRIGSREVGPGHSVYIIAEAGVNHDGDPSLAHRLIDEAKQAGADAVKFQMFSADRLAAADAPSVSYQKSSDKCGAGQREMLRRLELSAGRFAELKRHADDAKIDFLTTPFGVEELESLIRIGVPAIKIASPDLVNVALMTAAASSGVPLIVSTGASVLSEVDRAVGLIRELGAGDRLVLLHCVSAYPTPIWEARLHCIGLLRERFGVPIGFSDHTVEPCFGAWAVAAGAVVLEKHLTLDKSASGPDHFFSLEPTQFREFVRGAREAQMAVGYGAFGYSEAEAEVRRLARGSVIAAMAIPRGARILASMLAIQRPGGGLEPDRWNEVLLSVATADIEAGTRLNWSMIRPVGASEFQSAALIHTGSR